MGMVRHGIVHHANPFQPTTRPWCHHCHDETEVDVETHHDNHRLMYKEICRRCKQVVAHGIYANVPLIGGELAWAGITPPTAPTQQREG